MMERGFGCCNGLAISRCLGSGSNVLQYMEEKRGLSEEVITRFSISK